MKRAREAVAAGHSVVIGLQSTGESHTREVVNKHAIGPEENKKSSRSGNADDVDKDSDDDDAGRNGNEKSIGIVNE